jgi:lysozyme family protein
LLATLPGGKEMKDNWNDFFEMLIKHEGGFTDNKNDKGNKEDGHGNEGSTMLGVTAYNWAKYTGKPAPKDVMRKLTKEDVKPFYEKDYWRPIRADDLYSGLDYSVADMAVNAGPSRAAKLLQRVLAVKADGKIGNQTLKAMHDHEPKELIEKYYDAREGFYRKLDDYKHFGKGWSRRNKETLEKSLAMIS